jgi:membrane glycosyltransferase
MRNKAMSAKTVGRVALELGVLTILLWWMPLVYQIVLSIALSALTELTYSRLQQRRLRLAISDESIAKMIRNVGGRDVP